MRNLLLGLSTVVSIACSGVAAAGTLSGLPPSLILQFTTGDAPFQRVDVPGTTSFDKETGNYVFQGSVTGRSDFRIDNLLIVSNPDPFVSYSFGVVNISNSPLLFSFTFTTPVVGSHGIAKSSYGVTLTDGGNSTISATGYRFDAFATPAAADTAVDLVDFSSVNFAGGGGSTTFTSVPSLKTASFATTPFTTLGIDLDFGLSGGADLISTSGRLEIAPIPEPGTWALLVAGLAGILAIGRRRLN